jgi:thioesterase domain-containing protein/acyl carrier protein
VPIGRPIAGTTLRVADVHGDPLPDRVPGELLISGPGVTAGHLGSARTGAFVELDNRRWYRTGDLVVGNPGGDLVFLGRLDDQLNVGGVRIEPAEIEIALSEIDGVHEAAVVAGVLDGREIVVAHLAVPRSSGSVPDLDVVRRHLTGRVLPAAIPRAVVVHQSLPRTSHGKLDRRATALLPIDPGAGSSSPNGDPAVAHGSFTLEQFVEVWRRVLGRPDAGPDADFFALGGDSLAAVELVTAIGAIVDRDIPIATLLTAPTPAAAHTALGGRTPNPGSEDGLVVVTMRPGTAAGRLVLFTAAWDDVQGYRDLADAFDPTVTVLAAVVTAVDGTLDRVDVVTDRIVAAITSTGRSPDIVLGWSIGGVVAFEVGRRLGAAGASPLQIALVDTYFPGEQRHVWSNRWWKYKSMLRPGSVGAAVGELRTMFGRRVRAVVARIGRRLLVWAGESVAVESERRATPGGIPFEAMDHRPEPCDVPVVLYAATTTNPARTIDRWTEVATDLRVVRLDGRHRGIDSIMGRDRVGAIVEDLSTGSAPA